MADAPIRVLLVDDSPLALALLKRMLSAASDLVVVGTARNGREALEMIPQCEPGVICTDYYMPGMSGLEFVQEVMARFPCPILVISSALDQELEALRRAGALGVLAKPPALLGIHSASDNSLVADQLIQKIRLLAGVPVLSRRRPATVDSGAARVTPRPERGIITGSSAPRIVAIGASTGGPQVLKTIFCGLSAVYPLPILCVQHISRGFLTGLIEWLSVGCPLPITIARPGEVPRAGVIHFPEEGAHLTINESGKLATSVEPVASSHCPSITVTFNSLAQHYGRQTIAVLLTGMGNDGAEGMKAIRSAGGVTIAQDEASCAVFGMPKAALDLGGAEFVLPPDEIAATLTRITARATIKR